MLFWKDRGYLLVSDIERENLEFLELLNTLDYCGRNDSRESIYRFSNHFIPGALELLDEMGNLTPSQFLFFKAMSSLEHRRLTGEVATDFLKALYGACTEVDVQRGR